MIDNLKEENQKEHKKTSDRIDSLEGQVVKFQKSNGWLLGVEFYWQY